MRDFLIKKLKDAETALKGAMDEITTLKKQAVTDHEVCYETLANLVIAC